MDRAVFDRPYTAYEWELEPAGMQLAGSGLAVPSTSPGPEKVAGWIRLVLPLAISLALWTPILLTLRSYL